MGTRVGINPPYATLLLVGLIALALADPSPERWALYSYSSVSVKWLISLWTAHGVHYGERHALLNAATLLVTGTLAEVLIGRRYFGCIVLLGAPFISLSVLCFEPRLSEYRGTSGLVSALSFGVLSHLIAIKSNKRITLYGFGVALMFALFWMAPVFGLSPSLPQGVQSAWSSHAAGAVFGVLCFISQRKIAKL